MKFLGCVASQCQYLHKIDKVYVNVKTRKLSVRVDKKHFKVGSCLSQEQLKSLRKILSKITQHETQVSGKLEIKLKTKLYDCEDCLLTLNVH